MKPGYKTTEFWVTIAVTLIGAFIASDIVPADNEWVRFASLVVTGLTATGYTRSRTTVKVHNEG